MSSMQLSNNLRAENLKTCFPNERCVSTILEILFTENETKFLNWKNKKNMKYQKLATSEI